MNYYTYIYSKKWRDRRKSLIGKECAFLRRKKSWACNNRLELHHISYRNLGNETKRDVVTVCDSCHHDITWNGHYRRPMNEQEVYTKALIREIEGLPDPQVVILKVLAVIAILVIVLFFMIFR